MTLIEKVSKKSTVPVSDVVYENTSYLSDWYFCRMLPHQSVLGWQRS